MNHATLTTFMIYFLVIGLISYIASKKTNNLADFILGGRRLSGAVAALGAGASDMSGWLLLGLPGAVYLYGINQIWLPIGLSLGAFLNWQFVASRLRVYTEIANDALTIPAFLDHRYADHSGILRLATAAVILIFFTIYAASGFVGGALLFNSTFGIAYHHALLISAGIIVLYTGIGGFLAVSWIDFFQGSLMLIALIIAPIIAYLHFHHQHTHETIFNLVGHYHPSYLHAIAHTSVLSIISLIAWGLGYFGQPHILVRFMATKSISVIPSARCICMTWMIVSLYGAIFTGFIGIAVFHQTPLANAETVFLQFAQQLFHPWIGGILLAAVLSAIMSTIAAQLLAAASAITEDFYHRHIRRRASNRELVLLSRLTVLIVALCALAMSYSPHNSVLQLVSYAWAGLGAAFGPVILCSLYWPRTTRQGAIIGMIVGAATVLIWKHLSSYGGIFALYEIIPGFLLNLLAIMIVSLLSEKPSISIHEQFSQMKQAILTSS